MLRQTFSHTAHAQMNVYVPEACMVKRINLQQMPAEKEL